MPITFEGSGSGSNSKQARTSRSDNVRLYAPPSGKFSSSVQNYGKNGVAFTIFKFNKVLQLTDNDRRMAGGRPRVRRTRGNLRGRGMGRGWRN